MPRARHGLPAQQRCHFRAHAALRGRACSRGRPGIRQALPSNLLSFREQDIEVLTKLGEQTSSAASATPQEAATASLRAAAQELGSTLPGLAVDASSSEAATVAVQLLEGRIVSGELAETAVVLKVYPTEQTGNSADLLCRNELAAHASLQQQFLGAMVPGSERIAHLLGCVRKPTGEQVLVFRKEAGEPAEACCRRAAEELHRGLDGTASGLWEQPGRAEALRRQERLVKAAVRQLLEGLAFVHRRQRVHRRLTPANLLLDWRAGAPEAVSVCLLDLALSADVSDAALMGGATLAALWHGQKERENPLKELAEPLWARAAAAGAGSPRERQQFAVAEDVAAAGLLVAFLAFAPLACPPDSLDFATLQRLLGATFAAELGAAREYCSADERWAAGVACLDADAGAGWDLLQSMSFPDYKLRPSAAACLSHPFLAVHRM